MGNFFGYRSKEYTVSKPEKETQELFLKVVNESADLEAVLLGKTRFRLKTKKLFATNSSSLGFEDHYDQELYFMKGNIKQSGDDTIVKVKCRMNFALDVIPLVILFWLLAGLFLYFYPIGEGLLERSILKEGAEDTMLFVVLGGCCFLTVLSCILFYNYTTKAQALSKFDQFIEKVKNGGIVPAHSWIDRNMGNQRILPEIEYWVDAKRDGAFEAMTLAIAPEPKQGKDQWAKDFYGSIVYPDSARHSDLSGLVFLEALVSETGKLRWVKVRKSLSDDCNEEARRAFSQATKQGYHPLLMDGNPVAFRIKIPVAFWVG